MSDIGKNLLKLTFALLKHQVKNVFGEESLGVAAETVIEIGGEKATVLALAAFAVQNRVVAQNK